MSWFRSEPMEYVSIILQEHIARDVIDQLGDIGAVQFVDLNTEKTAFQRKYTRQIRRCDELERIVRFFEEEMSQRDLEPQTFSVEEFLSWRENQSRGIQLENSRKSLLDHWQSELNRKEKEYKSLLESEEELRTNFFRAVERREVIAKVKDAYFHGGIEGLGTGTGPIVTSSPGGGASRYRPTGETDKEHALSLLDHHSDPYSTAEDEPSVGGSAGAEAIRYSTSTGFGFRTIAGVLPTSEKETFERVVYRASRGNVFVRLVDVAEPMQTMEGKPIYKTVFLLYFRSAALEGKMKRICSAFEATVYDLPDVNNPDELQRSLTRLNDSIRRVGEMLQEHERTTYMQLGNMRMILEKWKMGIRREKHIFATLNRFKELPSDMLQARGWVLADKRAEVEHQIMQLHSRPGTASMPCYINPVTDKWPTPPTHFHTNKYTVVFQSIVNTYGVPRYREANPALFTAVTFPFLFGVMYGDIGHSIFVTLFGLFLVLREKSLGGKKLNEIVGMAFTGRYIIFLMGLFGLYCGFIYNDFFSIGTNAFGTRWTYIEKPDNSTEPIRLGGNEDVYPFGIDPAWHHASNELLFFNSMKMKMSVILGITQMMFGLVLKMCNAIHFRQKLDLFCEAIPQIVFMALLFGYMIFLIILKWSIDWENPPSPATAPPSLIDTLINVVLSPGTVKLPMFDGQATVQVAILLIVFSMVPIMLCVKPCIIRCQMKSKARKRHAGYDDHTTSHLLDSDTDAASHDAMGAGVGLGAGAPVAADALVSDSAHDDHDHDAEHPFGEVFWEKALAMTVSSASVPMIVVGYALFAGVTTGVLLVMDVLECFLHALRLHWVEFQNKFYKADGYAFEPFDFRVILTKDVE